MGIQAQSNVVSGRFEASMAATHLPRCRFCGAAHPLARKPALAPDTCPDCDNPASPTGETRFEGASLGAAGSLADGLLAIGRWLHRLAKGI